MAWVEIRRVNFIQVTKVAQGSKKRTLTLDWLPSDNPTTGAPYAVFVFNFELHPDAEPTALNHLSSPQRPSREPSPRRTRNSGGLNRAIPVTAKDLSETATVADLTETPSLSDQTGPISSSSSSSLLWSSSISTDSSGSAQRTAGSLDTEKDVRADSDSTKKRGAAAVSGSDTDVADGDRIKKRARLDGPSRPPNLTQNEDESQSESDHEMSDIESLIAKSARLDVRLFQVHRNAMKCVHSYCHLYRSAFPLIGRRLLH